MTQTADRTHGFTESVIREMTRLAAEHGAAGRSTDAKVEPPARSLG